jgi:hypothetical protein
MCTTHRKVLNVVLRVDVDRLYLTSCESPCGTHSIVKSGYLGAMRLVGALYVCHAPKSVQCRTPCGCGSAVSDFV